MRIAAVVAAIALAVLGCSRGSSKDFAWLCAWMSGCEQGEVRYLCANLAWAQGRGRTSRTTEDRLRLAGFDCATAATTCAELHACFVPTTEQLARCTGTAGYVCDGDVLIDCEQQELHQCGRGGLTCLEPSPGFGACVDGTCDFQGTARCDGDVVSMCSTTGQRRTWDCLASEESCQFSSDGGAFTCDEPGSPQTCVEVNGEPTCAGTGEACELGSFPPSCEGAVLVTCSSGFVGRRDCSALDQRLTCGADSSGTPTCRGAGTECDDTTPDECADGVITTCLFGYRTTIDCRSAGFPECFVSTIDSTAWARCGTAA